MNAAEFAPLTAIAVLPPDVAAFMAYSVTDVKLSDRLTPY